MDQNQINQRTPASEAAGSGAGNRPAPRTDGLSNAEILGYFSMPTPSLAQHNPAAYERAGASMPKHAGTCSHCGIGIRHHVVIRDAMGRVRFIGTTCAIQVGCDADQVRARQTDAERAAIATTREQVQAQRRREQLWYVEQALIRQRIHWEQVGDLVMMLRQSGGEFYRSLADQLQHGSLSHKQAQHVARATSATGRRNRFNAEAWDDVVARCTEDLPGLPIYNPEDEENTQCEN